jgi:hypothetical protein
MVVRRRKGRRELEPLAEILFTIGRFDPEFVDDWRRHGARLLAEDPHRYQQALEAYGRPWPREETYGR